MSKFVINNSTLTAIAEAIRSKTGGTAELTPAEMKTAIQGISGGNDVLLTELKTTLTPLLPRMNFAQMNLSQFKFCIAEIFNEQLSLEQNVKLMLEECFATVEGDEDPSIVYIENQFLTNEMAAAQTASALGMIEYGTY